MQKSDNFEPLPCPFTAEGTSALVSQVSHYNQLSFQMSIQCLIFHILWFLLVILLFIMASKCTAEVLPSVLMCKKTAMCFKEKAPVLGKLHADMSYSAIGFEIHLNESTIYIKLGVFKPINTYNKVTY